MSTLYTFVIVLSLRELKVYTLCGLPTQQVRINSFLGLQKLQFEHSVFQPGILLGMICIILWTLCVYKDQSRLCNGAIFFAFLQHLVESDV